MMINRPQVGLSVIIKKGSKVLIGKRKNIVGHGNWGFPGGHLEFGEELEEGVRREVFEETDLQIKNIEFQKVTSDIRKDIRNNHYITLFFTADYKSGKVVNKESHKCEGWKWVEWSFLLKSKKDLFLPMQNLLKQNFSPFKS